MPRRHAREAGAVTRCLTTPRPRGKPNRPRLRARRPSHRRLPGLHRSPDHSESFILQKWGLRRRTARSSLIVFRHVGGTNNLTGVLPEVIAGPGRESLSVQRRRWIDATGCSIGKSWRGLRRLQNEPRQWEYLLGNSNLCRSTAGRAQLEVVSTFGCCTPQPST
jgi:hypothetical protein